MQIDKKAETLWRKAAISLKNYQDYLDDKPNRFSLSLIDLLYVSNFKGGNATIHESSKVIQDKLQEYSSIMLSIYKVYYNKNLSDLNDEELEEFILLMKSICILVDKKSKTKIDGFSASYLSALLSAYFPNLIPILDRRILINLRLIKKADIYPNGQVKNIEKFYDILIRKIAFESRKTGKSIRDIDRELFIVKLKELQ